MATFTPTTNANAIPTVIAQGMLAYLGANMGLARFISRDVDWSGKDFASYGDTLTVTRPGSLTVQTITPGTSVTPQNATADKITATLNQYKTIDVLQEDITKLLQKPDLQEGYARDMAVKLAENVESYLFSLHPNLSSTVTFDATSATTIETSLIACRSKFSRLKVPVTEQKGLFLDVSIIDKLLTVQKYTESTFTGDTEAMKLGALGKKYNMNIFESQLVPATGSPVAYHSIATTRYGMLLLNRPLPLDGNGRGAIQTTMQDPNTGLSFRLSESYSHGDRGVRFSIDVLYGASICDVNQIFEIESF